MFFAFTDFKFVVIVSIYTIIFLYRKLFCKLKGMLFGQPFRGVATGSSNYFVINEVVLDISKFIFVFVRHELIKTLQQERILICLLLEPS